MTPLLAGVLAKVKTLPDAEQNFIASVILEAIEDERRWDEAFARSQDKLAEMANKGTC